MIAPLPSLSPAFWLETLLVPAGAVGLLFALAGATASLLASGRSQRAAWLTAFLAAGLFLGGWLLGVDRRTPRETQPSTRSETVFRVRTNLPVGDSPTEQRAVASSAPVPVIEPARTTMAEPANTWWPAWIWASGSLVLVGRMLAQRVALALALPQNQARPAPELAERVRQIAANMGLRRGVRVGELPDLVGPAAFGWFRPTILVPRGFLAAHSDRQVDAMLAHELAHLAARDPLWQGGARILASLLWWYPVVWWGLNRLRAASETAADEASVLVENGPEELAACLVALGGQLQGHRAGWLGMAGSGFRSHLGRRVERLLRLPSEGASWHPRRGIVTGIVLGGLLGAAGLLGASAWANPSDSPRRSPLLLLAEQVMAGQVAQARTANAQAEPPAPPASTEESPGGESPSPAASLPAAVNSGETAAGARTSLDVAEVRLDAAGRLFLDGHEISLDELGARIAERHQAQPELAVRLVADRESRADSVASVIGRLSANGVTRVTLATAPIVPGTAAARTTGADVADDAPPTSIATTGAANGTPPMAAATTNLLTRTYMLNPGLMLESLRQGDETSGTGNRGTGGFSNPAPTPGEPRSASGDLLVNTETLRQLFAVAGVDWGGENVFNAAGGAGAGFQSGNGKGLFFNSQNGMMLVRATAADLEIIESTLTVLNTAPQQLTIEAKFVEITDANAQALGFDWFLGTTVVGGGTNAVGLQTEPGAVDLSGLRARQSTTNANAGAGVFPTSTPLIGATNDPAQVANERLQRAMSLRTSNEHEDELAQVANERLQRAILLRNLLDYGSDPAQDADERLQLFQGDRFDWPGKQLPGADNMRVLAGAGGRLTGILTDPQYRMALRALEQRSGVDIMAAPRVTTVSGRQAQIQIVDLRTVVNGLNPEVLAPRPGNGEAATNAVPFRTVQVPVGPVLDVIPNVEADGLTLDLTLIATVTEFLGYDEPPEESRVRVQINGRSTLLEPPLPRFRVRQAITNVRLLDGQTVVLGGMVVRDVQHTIDKVPTLGDLPMVGRLFRDEGQQEVRKNLLVFVTATLIDPAGNRIHPAP